MEELLTQATVAIELLSFSYVAGSLALYTHQRFTHPVQLKSKSRSKHISTPSTRIVEPVPPAKRSLSPVEQLRQQCQQAGIKWRDAHGKNKHLKKHEMLEALKALNVIPIRRSA
ncbi:MAG: hypothetical protein KME42_18255 [Tildeniella nuda ZEHNDER 1965/U140]|nr:hypothetical protein [Tildeniella nuda ZEHNDER 1965/U140]